MSLFFVHSAAAQGGGGGGGDLVHGESASITGTGFGAVASPTLIYDDFSTGTLNALVRSTAASGAGTWETGGGDAGVFRSNAVSRGVHSRTAFHDFDRVAYEANADRLTAALRINETFTGDWFVDFWMRRTPDPGNSNWSRNYKTFRFYDNVGDGNQMVLTHIAPGADTQTQFYVYGAAPYVSDTLVSGQWKHYRLRFRLAASYTNDVVHFASAANGSTFSELYSGGFRDAANSTKTLAEFALGDYWSYYDEGSGYGDSDGAEIYTSSVYIANTWARVELGNHATYASATITEIQRTTSRSDTAIDYVVNKGLLSTGTVHEYVFDASNTLVQTTARTLQ